MLKILCKKLFLVMIFMLLAFHLLGCGVVAQKGMNYAKMNIWISPEYAQEKLSSYPYLEVTVRSALDVPEEPIEIGSHP